MDVWFYFYFKHKDECAKEIREFIKNGSKLNFEVLNISKNVYLGRDSTNFRELYSYDISNVTDGLFVKAIASSNDPLSKGIRYELAEDGSDDSFSAITEDFIKENFNDEITGIISQSEPEVTFWKPSAEFLISEVDLNIFIDDVESNKPLKNIFLLAGYENSTAIKNAVLKLSKGQFRRKLATTLSEVTTKYVRKIWKHKIAFDIEISESGKCLVSIKDEGQKNIHDFHTMHARSDGFKQFISLILSLSIDTKKRNNKGNLILIGSCIKPVERSAF